MDLDTLGEQEMADLLFQVLNRHRQERVYTQLRIWLRDLGKNVRDEQAQIRLLQKACRVSPGLADSLREVGLGEIVDGDRYRPTPLMGAVIQGFNRMVEQHLEDW